MNAAYADDIEELLGGGPPRQEGPSSRTGNRPDAHIRLARHQARNVASSDVGADGVLQGVSVTWLARVFNLDVATVRKRLIGCPNVGSKTSGFVYLVEEAAPYLVTPRLTPADFLKHMQKGDLPPQLQDAYWSGVLKRQKAQQNAGDLWHSVDVFDVMQEVLKVAREGLQQIPSTLDRSQKFTEAQVQIVIEIIDAIQDEMHKKLLAMAQEPKTKPLSEELEDV